MAMFLYGNRKLAIKGSGSYFYMQAGSKEKGKYQESMQSSTTHVLCHQWESDTKQGNITHKRTKRSALSQQQEKV